MSDCSAMLTVTSALPILFFSTYRKLPIRRKRRSHLPPSLRQFCTMLFSKLIGFTISFIFIDSCSSLICYDCYDTGPSNEGCTKWRNCTGRACLLYEGPDGLTTSAFCLLNLPAVAEQNTKTERQCWLDPDEKGKHCMCSENFCNKLRDRRQNSLIDPESLPIENATLLKRNPLIDYDDLLDEDHHGMNARPAPANILFPAAAEIDPKVSGDGTKSSNHYDDDLVPISHEDYFEHEEKLEATAKSFRHYPRSGGGTEETSNRAHITLPPMMILLASLATPFARLFV